MAELLKYRSEAGLKSAKVDEHTAIPWACHWLKCLWVQKADAVVSKTECVVPDRLEPLGTRRGIDQHDSLYHVSSGILQAGFFDPRLYLSLVHSVIPSTEWRVEPNSPWPLVYESVFGLIEKMGSLHDLSVCECSAGRIKINLTHDAPGRLYVHWRGKSLILWVVHLDNPFIL